MAKTLLANMIYRFFEDYSQEERGFSPHTISAYSTCISLLLVVACERVSTSVDRLDLRHFSRDLILEFLSHLEKERGNGITTRNARLAAIKAFFRFVALNDCKWKPLCEEICAIAPKKATRVPPACLSREEIRAFLDAPTPSTLQGARDQLLFHLLYSTGVRAQELVNLKVEDIRLQGTAHVRVLGKGKKIRDIPLTEPTVEMINAYLKQREMVGISHPRLILNQRNKAITRFGVNHIIQLYRSRLAKVCSSLENQKVTPHTFRHTNALHHLNCGTNLCVIKELLGHSDINTTHHYMEFQLKEKAAALDALVPSDFHTPCEWKKPDVMVFLSSLKNGQKAQHLPLKPLHITESVPKPG